ncbi:hypothetical protein [Caudoviricetes sp.]|nr:hypothetical protein [Caudoviricetes sp.]
MDPITTRELVLLVVALGSVVTLAVSKMKASSKSSKPSPKKVVKKETPLKVSGPSLSEFPLQYETHPNEKNLIPKKNATKKIRSKISSVAKVPKRKGK